MLEVSVHDAQDLASRCLPAPNDRGAQPSLTDPAQDAHARVRLRQIQCDLPSLVWTIVVDDHEFVSLAQNGFEQRIELADQRGNVLRLVEGGNDQREANRWIESRCDD